MSSHSFSVILHVLFLKASDARNKLKRKKKTKPHDQLLHIPLGNPYAWEKKSFAKEMQ